MDWWTARLMDLCWSIVWLASYSVAGYSVASWLTLVVTISFRYSTIWCIVKKKMSPVDRFYPIFQMKMTVTASQLNTMVKTFYLSIQLSRLFAFLLACLLSCFFQCVFAVWSCWPPCSAATSRATSNERGVKKTERLNNWRTGEMKNWRRIVSFLSDGSSNVVDHEEDQFSRHQCRLDEERRTGRAPRWEGIDPLIRWFFNSLIL